MSSSRHRGTRKAASSTASAPTTTTTSRGSAPPGRCRAGAAWLQALTGAASGDASLRGGYGLYHGRIFQSVFSQNGASLRTNPPYALARTITTAPGILNVSDPTLGFVFVPGPQAVRHAITIAANDLGMPYTHQWSASYERKLPWSSSLRLTYNGNHGIGTLKYSLGNLPQSPLDGPITVANHPNNAPAAGFPDLRGKVIDRLAGRSAVRWHRTARRRPDCRLPGGRADRRQRDQPARPAHQRAACRSALQLEPDRQQRRRVVVRRPADRVGQTARPRSYLHHQLHPQPLPRHDLRSHLRRRRRLEPAGARQPLRQGILALPHAAPLQLQRQLSAAVLARAAKTRSARCSAAGRSRR